MVAIAHLDPESRPSSHRRPVETPAVATVISLRPPSSRLPHQVYVRRRLLTLAVAVLALASLAALASSVGSGDTTRASAGSPDAVGAPTLVVDLAAFAGEPLPAQAVYVVRPGDSLWSIARQLRPGDDPRPLVDRLAQLNGGAATAVGQRLKLS
jgi:Tfp pilus assembly protein FimV